MWHTKEIGRVERELHTNIDTGLSQAEVKKRQEKFGENKLSEAKRKNIFFQFLMQFKDFMIIILIISAIISAIMSKIEGSGDYIDSIMIIVIVVFNAILGVIQENKAEKSLEALKKMSAPTAKVKRNGQVISVKSSEIVPGDIVLLETGSYVPADCRLIYASNLKIEESALTGETVPVLKDEKSVLDEDSILGDRINMAFSSTIVVNGSGMAIVTDTGMNSTVGKIASMIVNNEEMETPLQKKLGEVGKSLGIICLGICFFIFIIGVLKKIAPMEMFMTSVGLAVAAIPEGLPAIVTIMLSIGVTKMAKKNAIIRKLQAVETLGSSSVICSDKTGTLTQNKMQIVRIADTDGVNINEQTKKFVLQLACMCTDSEISYNNDKHIVLGDPTENAIVVKAMEMGENKNELYEKMERISEINFDSNRKLMTTIHRVDGKYRVITKGAPDILLKRCTRYYKNQKEEMITENLIERINSINDKMAEDALRVLGVAYSELDILPNKIESNNIENNLTFVGLLGMIDPPREGVRESIEECKRAGIKTVMITGDHIITAKAIAKELGILQNNSLSITGQELDKITEEELQKNIMNYSVFARVSPEHKVRIVKALQNTGAIVAMTGDGVNDAPALKKADIGVAMGKNGTDVAKNAADMVLVDDNFITIVEAVKQGRSIFENIKKSIHFLISTNFGEILTVFMGLVLGVKSPLLAIQLLWINLVTDSLPAIALALGPIEKNIMKKKPRDPNKSIFADGLWGKMIVEGAMIGMLNLLAFFIGYHFYGLEVGRTMAFVSLGILELVHCVNIKSEESIFKRGITENKYLIGAFILGFVLQIGVACVPIFIKIFKLVSLNLTQWVCTLLISFTPIVIVELQKKYNEIKFGKTIYELDNKKA